MIGGPVDRRSLLIGGAVGSGLPAIRMGAGVMGGDPAAPAELDAKTVQQAYDRIAAAGGGVLLLPPGRHRVAIRATTRSVQIQGHGRGVTILQPAVAGQPAIRLLDARGEWTSTRLTDFSIEGDPQLGSDGIVCGHEVYRAGDEFVGRVSVERVGFANLDRCIVRPAGNIGLYVDDCTFTAANVHLWAQSRVAGGSEMHAGCVQVSRSHFTGFRHAMAYLASEDTLSGQVSFADCVFEAAPGFVFYVDGFRCVGGLPALTVRGCWNEETATGARLSVAGKLARAPLFLFARDCSAPITFIDTPLGPLELIASQVGTENCALDNLSAAVLDNRSQLFHSEARQASGTAPGLCRSIVGPTADAGLHTPWFRMPLPSAISAAWADDTRLSHDGNSPILLQGDTAISSSAVAGSAALPFAIRCQQLLLRAGIRHVLGGSFATGGGRWLVSMIVYRRMSGGTVNLLGSGEHGFTGMTRLTATAWERLVNLSFDPGPPAARQGLFVQADTAATLQVSGVAVLEFHTRQEAIAFVNSGLFPQALS